MKSIYSGMRNLLSRICSFLSISMKNCKLELITIVVGIFLVHFSSPCLDITQVLQCYFSEGRCSAIAGYTSVIIGIYATVWSIFSTSVSKINEELLKSKVEGQLFFLIVVGLMESFATTILSIFIPYNALKYVEIMVLATILTTISFAKFIQILMQVTKLNVKFIVQEIDSQQAKSTEMQVKIDEIYHQAINKSK